MVHHKRKVKVDPAVSQRRYEYLKKQILTITKGQSWSKSASLDITKGQLSDVL